MAENSESRGGAASLFKDEATEERSGRGSLLGLLLGVAALLVGGAALYLTLTNDPSDALNARIDGMTTRLGELQTSLDEQEQALDSLTSSQTEVERQLASLARETESALNRLGNALAEDRKNLGYHADAINEINSQLSKFKKSLENPAPARTPARESTPSTTSTAREPTPAAGQRVHTIESGDILSKIAKEYGVSLDAIFEANPGIDPYRLRIGQQIIIPAP